MRTGPLISAAGHAALISLAIWGLPWISPRDRETISVTEVSFISEAEFEAAAAGGARRPPAEVVEPPEVAEEPALPEAEEPAAQPELAEPEEPKQDVASLAQPFDGAATLRSPETAFPSVPPAVEEPGRPQAVTPPRSRPAARIEPVPTPAPPEETQPDDVAREEAAPELEAETPEPLETAAAPREAAPEPVSEPAPPAPLALETSGRPRARPQRVAAAPEPPAEVTAPPAETPDPPEPPTQTAQERTPADLVRELAAATPATEPTPPTPPTTTAASAGTGSGQGPPLSASEKDGLKFAIQSCWNVPAGLREAEQLRIVVGAELASDGALIPSSVRMVEPRSAPDARYQVAYDAARRALIRCSPYTGLPRAKYARWRSIEVVFDPQGMVSW